MGAVLSLRRFGFVPSHYFVGFVVDGEAIEQVLIQIRSSYSFSLVYFDEKCRDGFTCVVYEKLLSLRGYGYKFLSTTGISTQVRNR